MDKKRQIPVHRMDDWFSGVYIKPFSAQKPFGKSNARSEPHRHDFYYCVLLDSGKMEMEVDFEKIQIIERGLFLCYPGQIHQINSAQLKRGWFLAFDPAILDEKLTDIFDQGLSETILLTLNPERSKRFYSLIDNLYSVYNDSTQMFSQTVINSMVNALLYQIASSFLSEEKFKLVKHSTRSIEIAKNFRQLLRRSFRSIKKPSEFASKMNITVSYLNDTVKAVTGFSATYHIQQELMREARRLLYYSDLTIKEITENLGFEDALYFNRLFSKVVGVSPGAFRKQRETYAPL